MVRSILYKKMGKKAFSLPSYGLLILGLAGGFGYNDFEKRNWISEEVETKTINVCFTPPKGCSYLIAQQIHHANHSIYMQAYSFTSKTIANELIKAVERGVKVSVILDKSQLEEKYSILKLLQDSNINVKIDHAPGIAHNKVIIIDESKVITGSYNFTNAADNRNVENVVLIDEKEVAKAYLKNWYSRWERN